MIDNEILVVETGTANLASVLAGLRRAGAVPVLSADKSEIEAARSLVLPGVGAFGAARERIDQLGIHDIIINRIAENMPTLCVCLGLQILCKESEENPGVDGLAVVNKIIRRFPDEVRVPQLGWNKVEPSDGCKILKSGYAYFANSYCLADSPEDWNVAMSEHGLRFVAAMERGNVLACQFHPELSGAWGLNLLKDWFESTREEVRC